MFQDYLMDQVDKQREHIVLEEFQKLEFEVFGFPRIMVDILTKLSGISFEILIFKRLRMSSTLRKKGQKKELPDTTSHDQEALFEEEKELAFLKYKLKSLELGRYE